MPRWIVALTVAGFIPALTSSARWRGMLTSTTKQRWTLNSVVYGNGNVQSHETRTYACMSRKLHRNLMIINLCNNNNCYASMNSAFKTRVRNGSLVKGRGSWSRDPGLIPSASGHFLLGCCAPFILARSSQNWNGNTGGPLCVCTPHMQSKVPPLPLQKSSRRTWVWHGLSTISSAVF